MRNGSWEEFKERYRKEEEKSSEWTLERKREAYAKVAKYEIGRLGIVQEKSEEEHALLAAGSLRQSSEWSLFCRVSARIATVFRRRTTFGGCRRDTETATTERRGTTVGVCGGTYEWRAPERILVVQLDTNEDEATVFRAHAVPQGLCENLINALKLLVNQQRDGDSPNIVTGLRERSRGGVMNGSRSFTGLDNHRAVEVGHVRRGLRPLKVETESE